MLGPDPADLLGRIVLVLGEPELAFLCDDIKDLQAKVLVLAYYRSGGVIPNIPRQLGISGKDNQLHALLWQC